MPDYEKFDEADRPEAPSQRRAWLVGVVLVVLIGAAAVAWWRVAALRDQTRDAERVDAVRAEGDLAAARAGTANSGGSVDDRVARLEALGRALQAAGTAQPEKSAELAVELRRVEAELDHLRSGARLELSLRREREAGELVKAGDLSGATVAWQEALALQQEINRSTGEASRNVDRELRLEQEVVRAVAEPLGLQLQALLSRATAAAGAGDFGAARSHYLEARALQERLNREFPRSRYSDLTALARIDAEIAGVSDEGLARRVDEQWEIGRRRAAEQGTEEAVKAFTGAAATQRLLNERFPRSRFVSMEKLGEIDADRQTALAAPRWLRVRELALKARQHLRRRQIFQAQNAVQEALGLIEESRARLPRARGLDEDVRLQLTFLHARAGDLAELQDRCYERLAPLPGGAPRAMWRTELQQADFARVMNANPSRTGGRELPVESVTQAEAEEFCRRLEWIMGAAVRLPQRAELDAAAGLPGDFQGVQEGPDEWLGREATNRQDASVWKSRSVSPESVPRETRSGQLGFRVVVELDLTALP